MKAHLLVIVAIGSALAADAPRDDRTKKEMEKLQGTWTAVAIERDGKQVPEKVTRSVKVVIVDDRITMKVASKGKEEQFTYKLPATEKPAQGIDLRPIKQMKPEMYYQGIYSLEGKTLKLCWSRGHEERPASFASKPQSNTVLMIFEKGREKAADARDAYEGTLVSVQGDRILVRNPNAKVKVEQVFTVNRGTRITFDDMDKGIGDLRAGLKVRVRSKQGTATMIEASTKDVSKDGKNDK